MTGRPGIIAFRGGFHGRTFGATSVTTSNLNYRTGYEPLLPGVHFAPFPAVYPEFGGDEEAASAAAWPILRTLLDVGRRAVDGRLDPHRTRPRRRWLQPGAGRPSCAALRELCDEHGILLIADEVQCGYGRTGKMWAFEHAGIVPDVVVVAKAIANGLPLSAIVSSRELQERWGRGAHGSTYGGNPVACAAGIAVLETMRDEGLVENAVERGAELVAGLGAVAAEDDRIGDIRGLGADGRRRVHQDARDRAPDRLIAACADAGPAGPDLRARSTRPSAGSRRSTSPQPRSPKRSRSSARRSRGSPD